MPSIASWMQSTPFLTWTWISSIASSLVVASRPIEVSGTPIQVGYQSVSPLPRGEIASGGGDARPLEQAEIDRIADRQADLAGIARRTNRGVAHRNDLLREKQAA
jgi:hypothetical protein